MTQPEEELPPHIRHAIERQRREGITYGRDRHTHHVSSIDWRPGERNALAEAIIAKVNKPMHLVLDGHHFIITPVHGEVNQ